MVLLVQLGTYFEADLNPNMGVELDMQCNGQEEEAVHV